MIYILGFLSGLIFAFLIVFFIGLRQRKKQSVLLKKCFQDAIELQEKIAKAGMERFQEGQKILDKKHMEEQLRLKLETEERIRKINEETLQKLRDSVK